MRMRVADPSEARNPSESGFGYAVDACRRYFSLVYELGKDIFRQYPADTTKILLASATSLGCQVVAVAVLFAYVKALESNHLLLGYPPRTSLILFALIAVVTLFLLVGFAVLAYRSNIATLSLCRSYLGMGTTEALTLSSKLPHWFGGDDSRQVSSQHIRQILSVDVNHRSRMARILLLAIIPLLRMILCAIALLYINPEFSALIFFAIGIPVVGLYSVGRKIADTMTSREAKSQPVFKDQYDLLLNSWENKVQLLPEDICWDVALGQPDSRHRLYFRRLRAKAFGQLLISSASTLGVLMLVMSLGVWVLLEQQGNWSLWLTYLVALRYFLSSLSKVARSVVQSSRFSRQVRRFTQFVAAAHLAADSHNPEHYPCPEHVVEAYKNNINSSDEDDFDED